MPNAVILHPFRVALSVLSFFKDWTDLNDREIEMDIVGFLPYPQPFPLKWKGSLFSCK